LAHFDRFRPLLYSPIVVRFKKLTIGGGKKRPKKPNNWPVYPQFAQNKTETRLSKLGSKNMPRLANPPFAFRQFLPFASLNFLARKIPSVPLPLSELEKKFVYIHQKKLRKPLEGFSAFFLRRRQFEIPRAFVKDSISGFF